MKFVIHGLSLPVILHYPKREDESDHPLEQRTCPGLMDGLRVHPGSQGAVGFEAFLLSGVLTSDEIYVLHAIVTKDLGGATLEAAPVTRSGAFRRRR